MVRVVVRDGKEHLGIMPLADALKAAQDRGLDLLEVNPHANPPVCLIIDYGKYIYEQQKHGEQKSQPQRRLKEIRLTINTDKHDIDVKARHAREFLLDGYKVKVTVIFRGREIAHPEFGERVLNEFWIRVEDVAKFDQPIRGEGRTMTMILAPDKNKIAKYRKQLQSNQQTE